MKLSRYIKIWWITTVNATQIAFATRFGAIIFLIAKFLRFFFFLLFLLLITSKTKIVVGYTVWQIVFFYATFNFIDSISQFFLREVYRFRYYVVSGNFDYILTKPFSVLFRSLFGGSDALDIPIVFTSIIFLIISAVHIGSISIFSIFVYLILLVNAILIAIAFHVFVLSMGVITTEVDNTIMLYRDLTQMGRLPVDIYIEPIRGILTFVIPVGIMMSFPPKALMGLLLPSGVAISLLLGVVFFFTSLRFWHFSLKHYASASS